MVHKSALRLALFVLVILLLLLTFYGIFNAGNPNSIFRLVVKDPGYDVTITVALAVVSFALIMALYDLLVKRFNVMRFFFGMRPKKKISKTPDPPPERASA